jgi:hypothetical protein
MLPSHTNPHILTSCFQNLAFLATLPSAPTPLAASFRRVLCSRCPSVSRIDGAGADHPRHVRIRHHTANYAPSPPFPSLTRRRYYENVTLSADVKNQKSLRVKLTNDTAGEFIACRQGGNKFSFSSSPIALRCVRAAMQSSCIIF